MLMGDFNYPDIELRESNSHLYQVYQGFRRIIRCADHQFYSLYLVSLLQNAFHCVRISIPPWS